MFDLAKAFADSYNPTTGLYARKDHLVKLVPEYMTELRAKIARLTKKYTAKLTVTILTTGFPSCPHCGKPITKPNMSGDKRDEFIKTCGARRCQQWYQSQGSDHGKELKRIAKEGFRDLLPPYFSIVEEKTFSFVVKCSKCGAVKTRNIASAHRHCTCSKGEAILDVRAANRADEKARRLKELKEYLPKEAKVVKVYPQQLRVDIHCSKCGRTQTKWLVDAIKWRCGCGRLDTLEKHWVTMREAKAARIKRHFRSLGIKYLGLTDYGRVRAQCSCGKIFVPNQPMMLKAGCRSCGVRHNSTERLAKRKRTSLARYGVEYPSQHPDIHEKALNSGYKTRPYLLMGKTYNLRGYEPQAVDYLIARGISPRHIKVTGMGVPSIPYTYKGRSHVYFPDILLRAKGKRVTLIEVKSTYTITQDTPRILAKKRAAERAGYVFHFLIMKADGTRLDTKKELRRCRKLLTAKS